MNKSRLYYLTILSFIGISVLSCSKDSHKNNQIVRNVILTEIETQGETKENEYAGVVKEGKSVSAAFMTGGKLQTVNVNVGDKVRKGQLLATLDAEDYQIGVNQLQVQFNQIEAEKKRMDEMYARHNIAPNDYEKFVAGYKQLKLQLDMANNKLEYTKLYSPSDGFISYKYMQTGELVDAGTPIYKISDDSMLEVSVDLPLNTYLNKNEIKEVYGNVPNIPEAIPLKIKSFTPDADNNQLYHMILEIPSTYKKDLTSGMNMTVKILMNNETQGESWVPSRAIFDLNGSTYVWQYNENDSSITRKQVTVIGLPEGDKSKVIGLSGNEKIVTAGVKQLKEGEKVKGVSNPLILK